MGPLGLVEGALGPGAQTLGPFAMRVALDAGGDVARLDVRVENVAEAPLHVEAVLLGFRWRGPETEAVRFLRHGWQSWSFTGGRLLDEAGAPPSASGPWIRGLHHALGARPADRAGWHESALVSVAVSGAGACLAGVLERGQGTGIVYLRRDSEGIRVEVELQLEVPVAPRERLTLEGVHLAVGPDEGRLLEAYAEALGAEAGARTRAPFQTGWCSWYQFFHDVSEADLLRNLEALAKGRREIPVDVVQLDDGYQRAIGDWLETNAKFPRGIAPLAQEIRDAGFRPGLWTAPFCVAPESRIHAAHPEWLLRQGAHLHRGLYHAKWSEQGWIHVLDTSRDDVTRHLMRSFAALAGIGWSYLKLDFLYTVAMQADAAAPRVTRAGRLRRGLEAIREGAGEEAFLLGCGCPLGAAVGLVDGMRIGPDVAPHWFPEALPAGLAQENAPGFSSSMPSTRNALRNVLARAWMHRRLWLNDPDCLMLRTRATALTRVEATTVAAVASATGGMLLLSDEVASLGVAQRRLYRETLAVAREIDASGTRGAARAEALTTAEVAVGVTARGPETTILLALNSGEAPQQVSLDLDARVPSRAPLPAFPLLGTQEPDLREEPMARARLVPHGSMLLRVAANPRLAIFCDYDGTFAKQDVGASLAKRYAAERRPALWERLRSGELSAWEYNMELLEGLELPEERLDAFLRSVEPSPGARELLAWCEAMQVPFRVLSDGFDRNLDRLQELHGLRFAYDSNHLWYENGRWRLAPGAPDPSCGCGTGVCKRGRIREFRASHPGTCVVHVGNGRVSDLCASQAADVVFAKDTLAEELDQQGVAYEPFEDLREVRRGVERLWEKLA